MIYRLSDPGLSPPGSRAGRFWVTPGSVKNPGF